jgi:hypothetical protein
MTTMTEKNIAGLTKTISERLRETYVKIGQHYGYVACIDEAADEIERLQRDPTEDDINRLMAALHNAVSFSANVNCRNIVLGWWQAMHMKATADELWACGLCGWSGNLLPAKHAPDCHNGKALGPFKPTADEPNSGPTA